MSYRKKTEKQYDIPRHKPNQLPSQQPLTKKVKRKTETEWMVDLLTTRPKVTKTEKEEITPMPEVIENKNRTSFGFKVGNQIVKTGIYGDKQNEEKMKFKIPKDVDKI